MPTEPPRTPSRSEPSPRERDLSGYIFSVSAGLAGVCVTVVGLFHLLRRVGELQGVADNLIALDALVFLASCLCAYLALRSTSERSWLRLERLADGLFLCGLAALVLIGCLLAYELI